MKQIALATALVVLLVAPPSRAEEQGELFSRKPYAWREDDHDKRLLQTKLMKAMETGFKDTACARVAASLLAAFAEATPYFQKRDNRFTIFRVFTDPITTSKFPADEFLVHMLHRAMIDGKAPESWLKAAKELKAKHKAPIDLARLAYAVDRPVLIDSVELSIVAFLQRYQTEVRLAPTVAQEAAVDRFKDRYLDRDVAWPGLTLADIRKVDAPAPKKGKKSTRREEADEASSGPAYVATLLIPQRLPPPNPVFPTKPPEPMQVVVRLAREQYLDLTKAVVSGSYLVHGRLLGFHENSSKNAPPMVIDLRQGLLFEDRDWAGYAGFASSEDVDACELAINDLSPLGLRERLGTGQRDAFDH